MSYASSLKPNTRIDVADILRGIAIGGSFIFYNWGPGLYRYSGHTASLLLGVLCVALQYIFCRWWLKSHSHRPFEALWRKFTWIDKKNNR